MLWWLMKAFPLDTSRPPKCMMVSNLGVQCNICDANLSVSLITLYQTKVSSQTSGNRGLVKCFVPLVMCSISTVMASELVQQT